MGVGVGRERAFGVGNGARRARANSSGMATWRTVRRIALELPESAEKIGRSGTATWTVRGKSFAWERPLRRSDLEALGAAAPTGAILGVRTPDLETKDVLLRADPVAFFTTPHFDGYAAVLIVLAKITTVRLRDVLVERRGSSALSEIATHRKCAPTGSGTVVERSASSQTRNRIHRECRWCLSLVMPLPLSILDQSPIVAGAQPRDAIAATIELASAAERLGYERFWLAEHHGMRGLADASPELLLARLTASTSRIRLGTGGIMLPHYSAFKVAETFRMLEALAPGRIDLGVGRAPGGAGAVSAALESRDPADFARQVVDTVGWLRGSLAPSHPFASLVAMPAGVGAPQPWILGSSDYGARLAGELGLPYVYAHFIGGDAPEIPRLYRERFRATSLGAEPRVMIAAVAIVAETDDEARERYGPLVLWRSRIRRGISSPVPSIAETYAHGWTRDDFEAAQRARRVAVGTPPVVRQQIETLAAEHVADEAMIVTIVADYAARLRSYELLAGAFALAHAA